MLVFKRKLVVLGLCVLLQACTQIDDYMLGKDNTPKPMPLAELKPRLNLVENWSIPVSKASKARSYLKLKPVIREHVIYSANASGVIEAVDKSTGRILWSKQLKQGILSGPSLGDGFIALGTDASSIIVLKQSDGSEVWNLKTTGDVLSKPVITAHKIIAKTIDGNLYAFDLKTGEKVWASYHGSPHLILKASASPVITDGLVLVGFSDGRLDAINVNTGAVVWQRSIAYASGSSDVERLVDIDADPIVRGEIVYLGSYQGYVGALSLATGQFIWRKPASIYKNMAIDQSNLYFTDSNDIVWAIDRENGHVKWKQLALKARGLTEPTLMGHRLILADKTGLVHVLSTQNGELISRAKLSAPIDISPAVAGKKIYVLTANGKLNRLTVS